MFISGYPGPAAIWCAQVSQVLLSRNQTAELIYPGTPRELMLALINSKASLTVAHIPHPGNRMAVALLESGREFILIQDDPRHALMVFLEQWRTSLPDAIRAIASGAAAAERLARTAGAMPLDAQAVQASPLSAVKMLSQYLQIDTVGITMPQTQVEPLPRPWHELWWALPADARALAEGALASFYDQGSPRRYRWGAALFKTGAQLENTLEGAVDITGRARILLQGPFINLSEGAWRVDVTLEFSDSAVQHEFLIEMETDRVLASFPIHPEKAGVQTFSADCEIDQNMERPFFLRLSTRRAVFDGSVTLKDVTMTPAAAPNR